MQRYDIHLTNFKANFALTRLKGNLNHTLYTAQPLMQTMVKFGTLESNMTALESSAFENLNASNYDVLL